MYSDLKDFNMTNEHFYTRVCNLNTYYIVDKSQITLQERADHLVVLY